MNIGIIDADLLDHGTKFPNLALMKLSGWHKAQGDTVKLILQYQELYSTMLLEPFDKIYISKVFSFTKIPDDILQLPNIVLGGTGFWALNSPELPEYVEHHKPDYTLYQAYVQGKLEKGNNATMLRYYSDYSIGFTTRGCFRKCSFCVNQKYDRAVEHSPLAEFLDNTKPYITLLDDNFLAYHKWESIIDDLQKTKKPFQFKQGLDIRLLTDQSAERLCHVKYHGDFIFAFDNLKDMELIESKLKIWRAHGRKRTKFYVLVGFYSQDALDVESAFQRIKLLMQFDCLPYIMGYESYKSSRWVNVYYSIARWCNTPRLYFRLSFRQYCEQFCEDKLADIKLFEQEHPEIAAKYFDMLFTQEKIYDGGY